MTKWIRRLFAGSTRPLHCGGQGYVQVLDPIGREVGKIFYTRPDSAAKRNYIYDLQHKLTEENSIKKLATAANKAVAIHDSMIAEIVTPYAKKIFAGCVGKFVDGSNKPIARLAHQEQFEVMMRWYANVMTDLVSEAYQQEGVVKKKS